MLPLACALLAAASLLAVASPAASADAGTIVVANRNDSGPGSLRQAIHDATPNETVVVPAGTYDLTSAELMVSQSITISGAGAGVTTIERSPAMQTPPFRVFHTSGAGNLITISGVTITGGKVTSSGAAALGGGVENDQATLTLSKDSISGNTADARLARGESVALGGGVYSTGPLNIVDDVVEGNLAAAGGGTSRSEALGGGIDSELAGGIFVRGSTFEQNTVNAQGATEGGIADGGGLIASDTGPISIADSTFHDNAADSSIIGSNTVTFPTGIANGGGAALGGSGPVSETNVTYTANVARATGGGMTRGGGLFAGSNQTLMNATLAGNSAAGAATNKGGNLWVPASDAGPSTATVENSVIAAGVADAGLENCASDGIISSLGHNIENRNECNFHASGDLVNADPLLGTLSDNGGPVETIPLKAGSPAIDAGAADVCAATDARGIVRPAGRGCDLGAFEVATPSATTGQAGSVTTSSAVLSGSASNPDFAAASAFFEYGTSTAYGSVTPAQSLGPTSARTPFTAGLNGLAPGTMYHFRIVVRNALGSSVGADHTFTTAPVFHPPQLTVRSVSVAGATATVIIACDGTAGGRCAGTVLGTVKVHQQGRSIVSIAPDAAANAAAGKTTTVTVARGVYSVSTGRQATLRLTANAAGSRLLTSFYRLPALFVFGGPPQMSRTITFAYPRVSSHVIDRWLWKLPPCGACVTLVQSLTIPDLPTGAHVTVSCTGNTCPFTRHALRPRRRSVTFTGLFAHSRLGPGTRIEVLITAPNHVGEVRLFTTRAGTVPLAATRCLPPGVRVPVACRTG